MVFDFYFVRKKKSVVHNSDFQKMQITDIVIVRSD